MELGMGLDILHLFIYPSHYTCIFDDWQSVYSMDFVLPIDLVLDLSYSFLVLRSSLSPHRGHATVRY